MKNLIKKNVSSLKISSTLAINEKTKELISQGKKVYKFGFGQSPFPVPDKIVKKLKENAHKKDYLSTQGLPELRDSLSIYLSQKTGTQYLKENIIITPGSKEAMFLMHLAFKGEIIIPASSWVSYAPQARIANNKIHWLQTKRENNWFPTVKELENKIKNINKKNIILILNSPNNPSGAACGNLKKIAEVVRKHKVLVLSDEIYSDLKFDGVYESISKYYPEGTLITGGLSKWCGAGGWRLGFFAFPKKLDNFLHSVKSLASETFSSVNTPTQYAAVEAYSGNYEDYKSKTLIILKYLGGYVYKKLSSNKVIINPPEGGFYIMPEFINKKYKTSSEMCEALLKETGVALLPGSDFGFNKKKMLARLSFTDFDGKTFLENISITSKLDDAIIEKFAPNVVEGVRKLSIWAKNL